MMFRPCIDIHNGKVKQIVGSSLVDEGNKAVENFVSGKDSRDFARLYKSDGLCGGHIILLNSRDSEYYNETKEAAFRALDEFPYGMQIGGGITKENATSFLDAKASHVIVTSYVFNEGAVNMKNLEALVKEVGAENIVLDLSCKKKDGKYVIVTNRWQKYTELEVNHEILDMLSSYCDEFLIHAADVEGKMNGIEEELVKMLGQWNKKPITYAGGISGFEDIDILNELGAGHLDYTIGSALDIFGGHIKYRDVVEYRG